MHILISVGDLFLCSGTLYILQDVFYMQQGFAAYSSSRVASVGTVLQLDTITVSI